MNKLLGKRGKPPLTKELIEYLNRVYPDTLPRNFNITSNEISRRQGERGVVDHLTDLFNQEE